MQYLRTWKNMRDTVARTRELLRVNRDSAELIVSALLGKPRHEIYNNVMIDDTTRDMLHARILQLQHGIPLEYLTKKVQFRNLDLAVRPGVFIPRAETEYMVDIITHEVSQPPSRVLEIGTGSGALAIALAAVYPGAHIIARSP